MKAKVLIYKYDDNSGFGVLRVYFEYDFDQAEKDCDMLNEHGSECKSFHLEPVEIFNYNQNIQKSN